MTEETNNPWRERCALLEAENVQLRTQLELLQRQLAELKQRVAQDSSNSSKPPSSDAPWKNRPAKKPSGRKRGGQPGHPGHHRELVPVEKVNQVVPCRPSKCSDCGTALRGTDPAPQRHQVTEIPPIKPHVTEYQLHALSCSRCGKRTRASLPTGVPSGAFGQRLVSFISLLSGSYLLSKRQIEQLLSECYSIDMSLGSTSNMEGNISEAVAEPVKELREHVKKQDVVNVDETGWKQQGKNGYLWVALSSVCSVFLVRDSRARSIALELLGAYFDGTVVSDRYAVYEYFSDRQLCWAHLIRDFRSMASRGGLAGEVGERLLRCGEQMFHQWHRFGRDEIRLGTLCTYLSDIRVRLRSALEDGTRCPEPRVSGLCKKLLARERMLWRFVRSEDIEPTNNAAERALRRAVLWRRRSFGTQSERGSRFVERILTVVGTLRLQKRNVLEYLTSAYEALLHRRSAPSLLPPPSIGSQLTVPT